KVASNPAHSRVSEYSTDSAADSVCSLSRLRGRGGEGVRVHGPIFLHAPSLSLPRKRGRGIHRVCGASVESLARAWRLWQELGPNLGGVLAQRGHGAVAGWRGVRPCGRGGVADDARGRGDLDAAELRMHREVGGGVDAGEGDVVLRKFLRQRRL